MTVVKIRQPECRVRKGGAI